jgi:hypothetical protein
VRCNFGNVCRAWLQPRHQNREIAAASAAEVPVFLFLRRDPRFVTRRRFINCVGAKVFLLDFNVGGLYRLTKRIERAVKFAVLLNRGEKVPQ